MGNTWTPKRVARLIELANGTRTAREIAQALGVSRNAVIGRMQRQRDENPNIKFAPPKISKKRLRYGVPPVAPEPSPKVTMPAPIAAPEKSSALCAAPGCRNTRQPGYLDRLCRDCRAEHMPPRHRALVF